MHTQSEHIFDGAGGACECLHKKPHNLCCHGNFHLIFGLLEPWVQCLAAGSRAENQPCESALGALTQPAIMKRMTPEPPYTASSGNLPQSSAESNRTALVIRALHHVLDCPKTEFSPQERRRLRRVLHMFEERGNCFDAPRSGRPSIYTDERMYEAVHMMAGYKRGYPTAPQLVHALQEKGVLPNRVDVPTFVSHLHAYVTKMGHQLIMDCSKTTFFLLKEDHMARCIYCAKMQERLVTRTLADLVFVDETQLAAAPPPKGKLHGRALELTRAVHSHSPQLPAAGKTSCLPCHSWPCW